MSSFWGASLSRDDYGNTPPASYCDNTSWFEKWFFPPPVFVAAEVAGRFIERRPALLRIETRHTECVQLLITDEAGHPIHRGSAPPRGVVSITAPSTAPLKARIVLEPRWSGRNAIVHGFTLHPIAVQPVISQVIAPKRVRVGDPVTVQWKSDADAVFVEVEGCGMSGSQRRRGEGALVLPPPQVGGILVLHFIANLGSGSAVKTKRIEVVDHGPSINLNRSIIDGNPGETVCFFWHVSGADEGGVWLEARGDRQRVPPQSGVAVVIGHAAEEMRLIATERGQTRIRRMAAIPRFLTALDQDF